MTQRMTEERLREIESHFVVTLHGYYPEAEELISEIRALQKVVNRTAEITKALEELIPKIPCDQQYSPDCTACELLAAKHAYNEALKEAGYLK